MTLLELVIYGLATYRLTRLITRDVITEPIREWVWKRKPPRAPKSATFLLVIGVCRFGPHQFYLHLV